MIDPKARKTPGIGMTQAPAFGHKAVFETLPCQADREGMREVVEVAQQDHPVRRRFYFVLDPFGLGRPQSGIARYFSKDPKNTLLGGIAL